MNRIMIICYNISVKIIEKTNGGGNSCQLLNLSAVKNN